MQPTHPYPLQYFYRYEDGVLKLSNPVNCQPNTKTQNHWIDGKMIGNHGFLLLSLDPKSGRDCWVSKIFAG